jgi:hypothetical protein
VLGDYCSKLFQVNNFDFQLGTIISVGILVGYDMAPNLDTTATSYVPVSTGFGGPGENPYVENEFSDDIFNFNSDDEEIPSLFKPQGHVEEEEANEDEEQGSTAGKKKADVPTELPPTATAAERVKAWASRLNQVYELCMPPGYQQEQHDDVDADDEKEGDENAEDNNLSRQETPGKKKLAATSTIFNWGRRSGDSTEARDTKDADASPTRSPATTDRKRAPAATRQRKFQRGNNASYDWQVIYLGAPNKFQQFEGYNTVLSRVNWRGFTPVLRWQKRLPKYQRF